MLSLVKNKSLRKRNCVMVRCRDATASSFVAIFRGDVLAYFHAAAVKRHGTTWNRLAC
jgi:hypothetical protein